MNEGRNLPSTPRSQWREQTTTMSTEPTIAHDANSFHLISDPHNSIYTSSCESIEASSSASITNPARWRRRMRSAAVVTLLCSIPTTSLVSAQTTGCISLTGSSQCSAFNASSVSTDTFMTGRFPFLQGITNVTQFDTSISNYISGPYNTVQYGTLLGCSSIASLPNTTSLYARYTLSVLCNAIVQNSVSRCGLSTAASRPLCANDCSSYAESEANVVANPDVCSNPTLNTTQQANQIRADFTNCALPAGALEGTCIRAVSNEPTNCGFASNTIGLCSYCGSGSVNSTDTCCYNSQAERRCAGVVLPTVTGSVVLSTTTPTSSPTSSSTAVAAASGDNGLSGGAIAGIVIGSVVALALLIGLCFLCLFCCRRRKSGSSASGSIFNQPSPARKANGQMAYAGTPKQAAPAGYEVLPGGRIARMSALEGHSGDSPPRRDAHMAAPAGAAALPYDENHRGEGSSSGEYDYSPVSAAAGGVLRPPPTGRRAGSLSSPSILGMADEPNPSGPRGGMNSPGAMSSQTSEQLSFFKDYYSQDEIHPGNKVATLWAYQPRASDEFALERGSMIKVVGIWDDGWATGLFVDEDIQQWESRRLAARDSGVSNADPNRGSVSPVPMNGEVKAFPLVCVCLPQHWRKTIEGDGSFENINSGPYQQTV